MFLKKGEDVKGALCIPVTTPLDGLEVFEGAEGLATRVLGETGVEKFNDTKGSVDAFGCRALTDEGETPLAIIYEVGVDMPPRPSPELYIIEPKGTPTLVKPKGQT